ncbi:uncharacterized protein [Amphiura filiformis]|uniref:uncharacterized protein n=1 Tax=Amphiura filiformis TaxID=82378 RepID=UPI003B21884A
MVLLSFYKQQHTHNIMEDRGGDDFGNVLQENVNRNVGKRRRSDPEQWKKVKVKTLRDKGEAHKTLAGKDIPSKKQILVDCRCRCCIKFTEEERSGIFSRFYDLANHEKQNIYLRGCVRVKHDADVRRRGNGARGVADRRSFVYTISFGANTQTVCQKSFCALHGIGKPRLKRKVLEVDQSIEDGRGKHNNHPRVDDDIRGRIRQHIEQFPARESHYSRSKQTTCKYLDASLNITKMHKLFLGGARISPKRRQSETSSVRTVISPKMKCTILVRNVFSPKRLHSDTSSVRI